MGTYRTLQYAEPCECGAGRYVVEECEPTHSYVKPQEPLRPASLPAAVEQRRCKGLRLPAPGFPSARAAVGLPRYQRPRFPHRPVYVRDAGPGL